MNLYFEFNEEHTRRYDGHRVWAKYDTEWNHSTAIMNHVYRHSSDRVWEETEVGVCIAVYNQYAVIDRVPATDEQMKEFFLVKLQAKNIDTES